MTAGRRAAIAVACSALAVAGAGNRPAEAAPTRGGARWVGTWSDAAWSLEAGDFGGVADVAVDVDGDRWVLDASQHALHRLSAAGRPIEVASLAEAMPPADGWQLRRLAVRRADGECAVLATRAAEPPAAQSRIVRLAAGGAVAGAFEPGPAYRDLAYLADGRLILARTRPRLPPTPERGAPARVRGGLDVFDAAGDLAAVVEPAALYWPVALDVAPSGDVFVANWIPLPAGDDGAVPPTPRPSWQLRRDDGGAIEGVVRLDGRLTVQAVVPFDAAEDVAAGRTVFVSRQADVFALPGPEPIWTAPTGGLSMAFFGRMVSLAAVDDRGMGGERGGEASATLVAGLDHCWFQGLVDLGGPAPAYHGRLDRPALAGPLAPLRLAGGPQPTVLQARTQPLAGRGRAPVGVGPTAAEPQSMLRLDACGRPLDQFGVCGDDQAWFDRPTDAGWAVDVAQSGDWLFEGGPELVTARRVDGAAPWPAWQLWLGAVEDDGPAGVAEPATPRLTALDADGPTLAVLDGGRGLVLVVDIRRAADGDPAAAARAWRVPAAAGVAVDVAIDVDRIHLADRAARRVVTTDLDGRPVASLALHDAPLALDAVGGRAAGDTARTAGRELVVLGRSGHGLRYRDGALVAGWRLPEPDAATDVAALDDGLVAVSFARPGPAAADDPPDSRRIVQGGVWRFAVDDGGVEPSLDPRACLVATAKEARPAVVQRGEAVTVTLAISGACPPAARAADVVIGLDTSRSMGWDRGLERAQRAIGALLAELDGGATRVAVVAFDADGRVVAPLDGDRAAAARAVARLRADGDTKLARALETADLVLRTAPAPPGRPSVVVVTDGELKDYPEALARVLGERGVRLFAVTVPGRAYTFHHTRALAGLVGADRVVVDPDPAATARLADALVERRWPAALLTAATVTDTLPADMAYEPGSAVPPAAYDPAARTLTWRVATVPLGETLTLRYRVRPQQTGARPTNRSAGVAGVDGTGRPARVAFPVPSVLVWDRASLDRRVYLPVALRTDCVGSGPGDVVLAVDASHSMDAPLGPRGEPAFDAARAAARRFARGHIARGGRVGLVTFAAEAALRAPPTRDVAALEAALAAARTAAGTRVDRALAAAGDALAGAEGGAASVVLVSDGHGADGDPAAAADALAARGIAVWTIAFGAGADAARLAALARPAAAAYAAADEAALDRALEGLSRRLGCR